MFIDKDRSLSGLIAAFAVIAAIGWWNSARLAAPDMPGAEAAPAPQIGAAQAAWLSARASPAAPPSTTR
jgi:hypothetical protein